MRALLFISFLIVSISGVFAQDCAKYKTGTFTIDAEGYENYVLKRTKKFQIESTGNDKVKYKIEWIDDCSYKLMSRKKTGTIEDNDVFCEIVKTGEDFYVVKAWMDGSDNVFELRVDVLK